MSGARLKRLGVTVGIVVLAVLLVLLFAPGLLICPAVGKAGSLALGVPVRLKGAGLRIFSSSVDLRGFEVGPEVPTKNAIRWEADRRARAPLTRLLRKVPGSSRVVIKGAGHHPRAGPHQLKPVRAPQPRRTCRRRAAEVVIGSLRIDGAKVRVVPRIAGMPAAFVPLPPLELEGARGRGTRVTMAQTLAFSLGRSSARRSPTGRPDLAGARRFAHLRPRRGQRRRPADHRGFEAGTQAVGLRAAP